MFYKLIEEEPKNATLRLANLLDVCNKPGYHQLDYQPVITLTKQNSLTGDVQGHAVVLRGYRRRQDTLIMKTIDSASTSGETVIECPIVVENGRQKLEIRATVDEWCLGSENCYVLYFN